MKPKIYLFLLLGLLSFITNNTEAVAASLTENADAHYRRAHYHAKSGNHNKAIEEYSTAYRLSPNSLVGRYSYQALTSYGVVVDNNKIQKQAREFRKRQGEFARKEIVSRNRFTADRLRTIENEKNADIRDVINNPSYKTALNPYFGNGYYPNNFNRHNSGLIRVPDPVATQARIDLVKAEAENKKQRLIEVANQKSDQLLDSATRKAEMIDETAMNLASQMTGKGVKLQSRGTNLYVRSYR